MIELADWEWKKHFRYAKHSNGIVTGKVSETGKAGFKAMKNDDPEYEGCVYVKFNFIPIKLFFNQ